MISKEHLDKYDLIYKDYPETFKWMQHKAGWEHMSLMAVLDGYESHIDELMKKEFVNEQKMEQNKDCPRLNQL